MIRPVVKSLLAKIAILSVIAAWCPWSISTAQVINPPSYQNTNTARQDTFPIPPSPGTAKVQASIMTVDSSSTNFILHIKIHKILGYGAATPPLVPNQEMKVNSTLLKESLSAIKPHTKRTVILQHNEEPFGGGKPVTEWTLIEIVKDKSSQ